MYTADQVAERLRAAYDAAGMTYPALRDRLADLAGRRPSDMWLSRRITGDVPLVRPAEVDPDLAILAAALDVPLADLLGEEPADLQTMAWDASREVDRLTKLVARYRRERRDRALHHARIDLERAMIRLDTLQEAAARCGSHTTTEVH